MRNATDRTSSDPWAPKGARRRRRGGETEPLIDQFTRRLYALGATTDEVEAVRDSWDDLDDDWTAERRYEFATAPDHVLLQAIADGRAEHVAHTLAEDEEAAQLLAELTYFAAVEAPRQVQQPVPLVHAWVHEPDEPGLVRLRAQAALAAEHVAAEQEKRDPRKTLVDPLRDMLDAEPDEG